MKNCKGLWFCGLAGSGKTTAAKYLHKKKNKSLLIDGDEVRKLVSKDLKYTERDRIIQINRLLGMAILCIKSNIFPIITSVYMNQKVLNQCKKYKIKIIEIKRNINRIKRVRKIYKNSKNVVSKDIKKKNLRIQKIFNNDLTDFYKDLKKFY